MAVARFLGRMVWQESPVITINEIVSWSDIDGRDADRSVIRALAVPVGDLRRAARFYERVFGFYGASPTQSAAGGLLTVTTATGSRLVLSAASNSSPSRLLRRWAFVVDNLDYVRARVWDLGVRVARDSGAPDHIYRRPAGASLYVHDRDCNEIELIELGRASRVAYAGTRGLVSLEHAARACR